MINNTVQKTISLDLCVSCGVCVSVCPVNAVSMKFVDGKFEPQINTSKCTDCGLCLKLCPGIDFSSTPEYSPEKIEEFLYADSFIESLNCYTNDPQIRYLATSGGVITSLIKSLLENDDYQRAYVLKYNNFSAGEAQLCATSSVKEVIDSAGSKYVPVSVKNVIDMIKLNEVGKSVVVALPCQILGIKKCMSHFKYDSSKILFLGLLCHKTFNLNGINYYEHKHGLKNEKLEKLCFRTKEKYGWPGGSKLIFDSGRELIVDKSLRKYCKIFFQLNRCLFCTDKFNMDADIAFGDCYIPEYQDEKGKSTIIIRTDIGKKVFDKYRNIFFTEPVEIDLLKQSQDYYEEKKERLRNVYILQSKEKVNHESWYKKAKKSLRKSQKLLKFGKKALYNRIDRNIYFCELKNNETIRWHLQTCKLALVWITGILCKFRSFFIGNKKQDGENIIILGGELFNKGAQAMVYTVVDSLKQKYPDKNLYLCSFSDYDRTEREKSNFSFEILPWDFKTQLRVSNFVNKIFIKNNKYYHNESMIRKIFKNAFLMLDISGFGLSSQFGDSKSYKYMLNIIIACKYKISFYILPQSFGPFDYSHSRNIFLRSLFKIFLPYPEKIFVREKDGLRYVSHFTSNNVVLKNDIVLMNDKYDLTRIYKAVPQMTKLSIPDNSVGVVPNRNVSTNMRLRKMYDIYYKLIKSALENGKKVYIIKHAYQDVLICRQIKEMFNDNDDVVLLNEEFNVVELEHIISQLQVIAGSRYHSIIHAYKNHVPALVIGWAIKYQELLALFDQEKYLFDCRSDINESELIDKWKNMLTNSYFNRKNIKSVMEKLKSEDNVFDCLI